MEFIKIPLVIKGVTLDAKQQQTLKEGTPLYIENMLSKRGTLFNATVQFNTDHQYVEFLFGKNIQNLTSKYLKTDQQSEIPSVFRGIKLKSWQVEKLNRGDAAYVKELTDKNGRKYQGYITFNKATSRFNFFFKKSETKKAINDKIDFNKNRNRT